jgi:NADH-quinone oxidoreductase subunit L
MLDNLWTVPAMPIMAFTVIVLFTRFNEKLSKGISIFAIGYAFVYSLLCLIEVLGKPEGYVYDVGFDWLVLGSFKLQMGMYVDALTVVMLMVVTIVALLVHIYSIGYMQGDPRTSRYFSFLSLFSFSMLGLVLANNFFMIFCFWELVGVSSYFLIGFWYEKKSAGDAGKKAFITNRIGDFGFIIGLLLMFFTFGSLSYSEVFQMAHSEASHFAPGILAAIGIFLFCGAVGKSAQFPLHVWLPDAMEGPTPVSALIHAATMVAAGVYMIARSMPIYHISPEAGMVVAWVGGITSLMAATMGLVQNDIKRVLAYSTVSQLGYMVMALGLGSFTAGTFHLLTHAFFKACLFLGAGSVIHAVHTQNIHEMGGLSKKMKITSTTFIIASLSIAGIFPLSGFWSKDEIIASAEHYWPLLILALLVAFMTAFYMFRIVFLTFFGKPRNQKAYEHAHESPRTMSWPLIILAFLSIFAGWVGIPWLPKGFGSFVIDYGHHAHHGAFNFILAGIATVVALSGIFLAYLMYIKKSISPVALGAKFAVVHKFLFNKWYWDEIYHLLILNPTLWLAGVLAVFDKLVIDGIVNFMGKFTLLLSWLHNLFDKYIVDGTVNGIGHTVKGIGWIFSRLQTGRTYNYALGIGLGVVLILIIRFLVIES